MNAKKLSYKQVYPVTFVWMIDVKDEDLIDRPVKGFFEKPSKKNLDYDI